MGCEVSVIAGSLPGRCVHSMQFWGARALAQCGEAGRIEIGRAHAEVLCAGCCDHAPEMPGIVMRTKWLSALDAIQRETGKNVTKITPTMIKIGLALLVMERV